MKSALAAFAIIALLPGAAPAEVAPGDFYPMLAMRMHQEGETGFQAEYGQNGLVINCAVTKPSGFTSLDEATCPLAKRLAHFKHHAPGTQDDVMVWRIHDVTSGSRKN